MSKTNVTANAAQTVSKQPIAMIVPITVNEITVEVGKHDNVLGYIKDVVNYAGAYKKDGIKFSWVVDGIQKSFVVEKGKLNDSHAAVSVGIKGVKISEMQNTDFDKINFANIEAKGFGANYLSSILDNKDFTNLRFSKSSSLMNELKACKSTKNVLLKFRNLNKLITQKRTEQKLQFKEENINCKFLQAATILQKGNKITRERINGLIEISLVDILNSSVEVVK